jgi:large subunit ribosomal protein L6
MKQKFIYIYIFKSFLIICGSKGRFIINLKSKILNSKIFLNNNELFFIDCNKQIYEEKLVCLLQNIIKGVNFSFSKKLNLIGIGFRCWTVFDNEKKFLIVKTSLSKDSIIYIPNTIDVFCLNSTTIFIMGIKKADVNSFVLSIKRIKKPNFYKQKGIFFENEIMKTKIGKKM